MHKETQDREIDAAKAAVEDSPMDPGLITQLGWAYFRAAQYNDAITVGERGLKAHPSDFGLLGLLGWAYLEAGQDDAALACFQRATDLYPNDARGYNGFTNTKNNTGKR